uniref:Uncharacterized protein n=1 Tax=Brassica oleracea var. oleracea TaxID=109376 RepID=A0A0D3E5M8_BRAOL
MAIERMRQLMSLWSNLKSSRVSLTGGNHTAASFFFSSLFPISYQLHFWARSPLSLSF